MALRLHRGGKLLVFGMGTAATDAQHIAVEFVHPVIVGKRALPAVSLTNDVATDATRDQIYRHNIWRLMRLLDDGPARSTRRGVAGFPRD